MQRVALKAGGGYRRVTASRYVMLSLLADNAKSPPPASSWWWWLQTTAR